MRKRKMGGGKDGRREKGKVDEEEEDGRREGWEGGGREGRWMRRMGRGKEGRRGRGRGECSYNNKYKLHTHPILEDHL